MVEPTLPDISRFPSLSFCDMLSDDEVLEIIEMKKKVKLAIQKHNHKIYHSEKSGWLTDVDDPTQATGRKRIRRATEERLWLVLAEWYGNLDNKNLTLAELYPRWLERKTTPRNAQTIKRINASWKAYYGNEPLSQRLIQTPMSRITPLMLTEWAESLLKKHYPVDRKKFSRIFSIVRQCFEYASDEDVAVLTTDTWAKARKKINRELIAEAPAPLDEEQVFTDDERRQIAEMVHADLQHYRKQASSAGLQILFLLETGLRIGECCGLKWSDVKGNRLYIQRQADNDGVRNWTKTGGSRRDIPLTTRAQDILQEVSEFNEAHGYGREWIFQSGNPAYDYRLSYNAADRKLRKLCARLNTVPKSPHKLRKTCISTLLDNPNVNDRTVQRFAGHSDISTTYRFYNFERKSKEEQALAIDVALSL